MVPVNEVATLNRDTVKTLYETATHDLVETVLMIYRDRGNRLRLLPGRLRGRLCVLRDRADGPSAKPDDRADGGSGGRRGAIGASWTGQ